MPKIKGKKERKMRKNYWDYDSEQEIIDLISRDGSIGGIRC